MRFFKPVMISAVFLALIAAFLAAQRMPQAPLLLAPRDGQVLRSGSPIEFRWRMGGTLSYASVVWRRADYFVICVKEYAPGDFPCSYPQSTDTPPWADRVTGFDAESGAPGTSWAELITVYSFERDSLDPDLRDIDLMWTVAACASTSPDSCHAAAPQRRLRIANLNLTMTENESLIRINPGSPPEAAVSAHFENDSNNASGPVEIRLQLAQLKLDSSLAAVKDLTGLNAGDEIMLKDGRIVTLAAFQAMAGQQSDVKGILVKNGFRAAIDYTHPDLPAGDTFRYRAQPVPITTTGNVASGSPVKLFLEAIVDPNDLIQESDESAEDNTDEDQDQLSAF